MVWGRKPEASAPAETETDTDNSPLPPRQSLPRKLQQIVDREDDFYDDLYSPYSVDSTDTPYRYAAYANRIRTILLSAHRYVAYTSDIGESFRPVAHPILVRSAYAVSWAYLLGDVSHEGYKAYLRNRRALTAPGQEYRDASVSVGQELRGMAMGNLAKPLDENPAAAAAGGEQESELTPWPTNTISLAEDYRMVMAKRAIFQGLASMGLPAFTIHSVVKYSGKMVRGSKIVFVRTWVPIGLGLTVVPFLPYIFDHPVEEAVDWAFGTALRIYGGEDAVRPLPAHALKARESGHSAASSGEGQGVTGAAAQLSWEEYKSERHAAREERKESGGGGWTSLSSYFGDGGKEKKE
ncbi:hypothetical protein N7481_013166 [Penicillium waksmanii]|uniref:uncharacterized protein n=1 Tax=Penicillium waksmanii TaxID=69791 RepID=UPI002546596A|nr:uncharacterized protein N7481_013166 [Penicillium waksmanii]KAJ5966452.1 hypothetical protein N7481_013166 [Penicillium waksmanii]